MAVIEWPAEQFRLSMSRYFIDWTSRSAGMGLSGHEQIIDSGTGRWRLTFALIVDPDADRLRRFEALVSEMRGRLNTALIPLYDAYAYDRTVSPLQIPHSDGTWHTDGTGAMTGEGQQPMRTVGAAAAGASQLTVGLTDPTRPAFRVGDLFTVNGFLYRVVRRNAGGWVKIEPPLREAIPDNTLLETDPIMVRVKFATDREGERARDLLSWGEPVTLSFVEDFDR
ncbi:hypothetical protein [Paracoccus sp. ME4]|uniref:hypothetical protein n=1 Tax=Paracoccus sp. ME4 TaxID=3138066 RepID=UPI00398A9A2F